MILGATLRNIRPKEEQLGINRIKKILDEKIKVLE